MIDPDQTQIMFNFSKSQSIYSWKIYNFVVTFGVTKFEMCYFARHAETIKLSERTEKVEYKIESKDECNAEYVMQRMVYTTTLIFFDFSRKVRQKQKYKS